MLEPKRIAPLFIPLWMLCVQISPVFGIEPCELAKLTPGDAPGGGAWFGFAVDISSGIAVVGSPFDSEKEDDAGAIYVFTQTGTVWSEQAKVFAPDAAPLQKFGFSVAAEGDRIVVGAIATDLDFPGPGAVYVFRPRAPTDCCETHEGPGCDDSSCEASVCSLFPSCCSSTWDALCAVSSISLCIECQVPWAQEAKLSSPNPFPNDVFGSSVSISGDSLVVGSPGSGAFVFRFDGASWVQEAHLLGSNLQFGDRFGLRVSIHGATLVVGAEESDKAAPDGGAVYVFTHDGVSWMEVAVLTASDAAADDRFGWSVAIYGDTIAVGAPGDGFAGSVYLFRKPNGNWIEEFKLENTGSDSVALESDLVVIGNQRVTPAGTARVFRNVDSEWVEESELEPSDVPKSSEFGISAGLANGLAILGSRADAAYIFAVDPDCNGNGRADLCDVLDGSSADTDGNNTPDECAVSGPIPTMSTWGLAISTLLLLICARLCTRRQARRLC